MKLTIITLVLALFSSFSFYAQYANQIDQLDNFIKEGINQWNPPGLAVTIVKDNKIIYTKGFGVTNIDTQQPVDVNTLFGCMSTTKAFVAAGIAMLVDEGKLKWEDKVIDYLPEFQLKDPYLTREINIKDLLTHRTGIGNTDYLWGFMNISSDSILYKMRDVEKSYSLRSSFVYQNIFYLAAGKVIEKLSGKSWGAFLKERIYDPLGMTNTYATMGEIDAIRNKADAHYDFDGKITKTEQLSADKIGPAGSMWSSIEDIGKWTQFLLNEGKVNDQELLKPETFKELFTPQQIIPSGEFYPSQQLTKPNWMTYGLGWFQHDYNGKMVQFHTGSLPGMVAIIGLIPEDNVGVYVMGNLDHVELRHAIMYATFDLFTEGKLSRNWSKDLYGIYHPNQAENADLKPIATAEPTVSREDLVGVFENEFLGRLKINIENGIVRFNMNNMMQGTLSHWHYNTFKANFDLKFRGTAMVNFRLGDDGKLSYLEMYGEQFHLKK